MADQTQRRDYLDEHLPYMLATVRYNFNKLGQPQYFRDWNAYFESFAVNARNLIQFLDNADTGNFKASDFIAGFRIRKGDIQGPLVKLRDQVFHLGKSRPRNAGQKFDLSYAKIIFTWIEAGMEEFLEALPEEYKKHWNATKADPGADRPGLLTTGPTGPSAPRSASSSITATTSTSSSINLRFVGLSEKKIHPTE